MSEIFREHTAGNADQFVVQKPEGNGPSESTDRNNAFSVRTHACRRIRFTLYVLTLTNMALLEFRPARM